MEPTCRSWEEGLQTGGEKVGSGVLNGIDPALARNREGGKPLANRYLRHCVEPSLCLSGPLTQPVRGHSLTHAHSLTQPLTHSLTHALTHSLTPRNETLIFSKNQHKTQNRKKIKTVLCSTHVKNHYSTPFPTPASLFRNKILLFRTLAPESLPQLSELTLNFVQLSKAPLFIVKQTTVYQHST